MNCVSKKLYAVLIVSVLMLCFSVVALASGALDPGAGIAPSSSTTDTGVGSSSAADTSSEPSESGALSSEMTDGSSDPNASGLSSDSNLIGASSDSMASATISMTSSTTQIPGATVSQSKTSSKTQYGGTVDTNIDDGIDTSGWGDEDDASEPVSVGTEGKKAGNKKMLDVAGLFWILIWIPVLLIIASIAALIYVNRKGFVGGDAPKAAEEVTADGEEISSTSEKSQKKEKKKKAAKRKENHNKRTNVYRPRD